MPRFVDPSRSLLEARQLDIQTRPAWLAYFVRRDLGGDHPGQHLPGISIDDARWQPAQAWWGGAAAGQDAEIDVVAAHRDDRTRILVGEVKLSLVAAAVPRLLHDLEAKARTCDWARDKQLTLRLWTLRWRGRTRRPPAVIDARELMATWRGAIEA